MLYTELMARIDQAIARHNLIQPYSTIILGLSGGPDSMFLLHVLARLHNQGTINLVAAHLDHEWRTNSSDDALFCQKICDQLGVPLTIQKMSQLSAAPKFNGSLEERGRIMRRHFLETVRAQHQASAIALGHHADDQQETFFIRLIRGTSLSGLIGMQPKSGSYIRPLLTVHKAEILNYLTHHAIPYCIDPSNESDAYLRNRIRNRVIPALQSCDQRFDKNFFTTLERLSKTEEALEVITSQTIEQISSLQNNKRMIAQSAFAQLTPALQDRIIMAWLCSEKVPFPVHEGFLKEIKKFMLGTHGGTHAVHAQWALIKQKQRIWIEK